MCSFVTSRRWFHTIPTTTVILILLCLQSTVSFQYNKDTLDTCSEYTAEDCHQSGLDSSSSSSSLSLWFSCPVTCSKFWNMEGSMAEIRKDPQAFYELTVQPIPKRESKSTSVPTLSLEDYEGYVTVFATVPTSYSGMAYFYLSMLEHIASVYPFTVQILLQPLDERDGDDETCTATPGRWDPATDEEYRKKSTNGGGRRVILLEPTAHSIPILEYVVQAEITAGSPSSTLRSDRVTVFIISYDGRFIERLISPTITELERRIAVHLLQLEQNSDF